MSSIGNNAQNLSKKMVSYKTVMEKTIHKITTENMKHAENFIRQVKEPNVIDDSKFSDAKIKPWSSSKNSDLKLKAWTSLKDLAAVDYSTLKVTLGKFASEQNARLLDLSVACAIKGEKLVSALAAAVSAFRDAMKK
nr:uncharacterized protein LOC128683070 [Plodia interpunctella]